MSIENLTSGETWADTRTKINDNINEIYEDQGMIDSGNDYHIDNISGDGTTWNPVTLPSSIRMATLKCRVGNDATFDHCETPIEFHFAKTATPGDDWIDTHVLTIPIIRTSSSVIGYVRSAAGSYVNVIGLEG